MEATFTRHEEIAWRGGHATPTSRIVAEEVAVALSYNGSTHAVMMATPADLEDFGIGFTRFTHPYRIVLPADATWRMDLPTAVPAL